LNFKRNVLASYAGQIYVTLISILMVPIYLRYMGSEAYGMVGFFAMLQAWFQLLDMGLTPTMARETARYSGGATDALSLRRLLRALEGIFVGLAILGAALIAVGADLIAHGWLKVEHLAPAEVRQALMLMGVIVALRWVCGLYRGAINGFERLVWLNSFNILVATVRFVLVIPYFIFFSTRLVDFFWFQLGVALLETLVLVLQTYRILPAVPAGRRVPWEWSPLRGVLKFSSTIAFTSSVWVLVTQTDKLVLSKLLPLTDYAYFTLAVLVASGVMVVSGPISGALLPRMTRMAAAQQDAELIRLYRNATQLVAAIAVPVAVVLAFFAAPVLCAWTGDPEIGRRAGPVLALYAIGNGIMALAAFPYYLQFAQGNLRLHLIGSGLFLALLVPALVWATWQYGVIGAGYAWVAANAIYFLGWVPMVHRRLAPGLHQDWLLRDVAPIVASTVLAAAVLGQLLRWPDARLLAGLQIALVSAAMLAVAAGSSAWIRANIGSRWRARWAHKEAA
jgi:O-antigen/teichoic acid export membrane protein